MFTRRQFVSRRRFDLVIVRFRRPDQPYRAECQFHAR